jgi:outer membrane biosynthesis protein TonB
MSMQSAASRPDAIREPRRFVRYASVLAIVLILFGGALYLFLSGDNTPPARQVRDLTVVKIITPPPPPPPPPPMPEQKMIEQPKMVEPELKPPEKIDNQPPKDAKDDQPPGPLSLDAKAEGPGDLFQLGGHPGGSPFGGGGGTRWGWYASIVQSQVESALRNSDKTRNAVLSVQIRLWADDSGRVIRVQITPSTGDAALDEAVRNEVLGGLVLRQPPPKDMPMPMVLSVSERRPS